MSVREEPRAGTELAGYRIEALLGRGGMAAVYRAEDLRLGRPVALKLLAPELAEDESFRERFLRESRLAASLDHANVIPIYEAGEADGRLFIAMRYVEGTDLAAVLEREGALRPSRVLALLGPVAGALDAAHARGLVHRDVKPGNILIAVDRRADPPEHVYLSDFGLTKRAASESGLTQTGQLVGTPDYVAPEQLARAPLDGSTDLYSFACVLFECLTGAPPFQGDSLMAVLWAHVNDPPPRASERRPGLPAEIDAVLTKAMAKRPEDRYATCREFAAAAREALALATEPHGAALPRKRRLRRGSALVALVAVLIGAIVTAAVLLWAGGEETGRPPGFVASSNSVAVIDPSSNELVTSIPVGNVPTSIAVGEGAVWVSNSDDGTISRIDPKTRQVVRTIATAITPADLAVGEGSLWITDSSGETLARVDPGSNRVEGTIDLRRADAGPFTCDYNLPGLLAVGEGSVWVAGCDQTVARVDPVANKVVGEIGRVDPGPVATGEGAVWVGGLGTIARIDPQTGAVKTIDITPGEPLLDTAVAFGSVWATQSRASVAGGGTVWKLDPETGLVERTVAVGAGAFGIGVGRGSLWVANSGEGTVTRIDPGTNKAVAIFDLGGFPRDVAVGEGYVWVTVS